LAQWPRNPTQALRQASAALQLLPQPKVVATLSDLVASRHRFNPKVLPWLLDEVDALAAFDRAVLITQICATIANRPTIDTRFPLPIQAEPAVMRLPPEQRGSALRFLTEAAAALPGLDHVHSVLWSELETLPEADRLETRPRKRKDAPA